ncbi:MAG: hypothetical protein WC180_01855 [Candidatus Paceibacterota bacterium]
MAQDIMPLRLAMTDSTVAYSRDRTRNSTGKRIKIEKRRWDDVCVVERFGPYGPNPKYKKFLIFSKIYYNGSIDQNSYSM